MFVGRCGGWLGLPGEEVPSTFLDIFLPLVYFADLTIEKSEMNPVVAKKGCQFIRPF